MRGRRKAAEMTREEFKATCTHRHELVKGCYCPFERTRCDMEWPKKCQRLFYYDLRYGNYKRESKPGSNVPKWNRHKYPDLFDENGERKDGK